MNNPIVTHAQLEEFAREGNATKVVDRITHREYDWKSKRYFCEFTDRGWVIKKSEPRIVYVPEPPSVL